MITSGLIFPLGMTAVIWNVGTLSVGRSSPLDPDPGSNSTIPSTAVVPKHEPGWRGQR